MSAQEQSIRTVVVTGDVTIDWNLARLSRYGEASASWNFDDTVRACALPGGALMLADLLRQVVSDPDKMNGVAVALTAVSAPEDDHVSGRPSFCPVDPRFHHSYVIWDAHSQDTEARGKPAKVWRVKEFMGLDRARSGSGGADQMLRLPEDQPEMADLVILDDAGLGFRDIKEAWPKAIRHAEYSGWVLVKMASPIATGPLWEHLLRDCGERLIVTMTANDLRRTNVHISKELSWERTAQDLFWELVHNPAVNGLSRCAHVIVSFGTAGALLLSRQGPGEAAFWRCLLFFDPEACEDAWGRRYPGGVVGYTSCLTASLARQIILDPQQPDLAQGIQAGVAAMRKLQEAGYGSPNDNGQLMPPVFPYADVAALIGAAQRPLGLARVQDPVRFLQRAHQPEDLPVEEGFWTILNDACSADACELTGDQPRSLRELARDIVLEGPDKTLRGVPLGKFEKLMTADRREIESFRAISGLITEYCRKASGRPLSIAVFGPPGSGKSFGIKQVAAAVAKDGIEEKTFNLSQFGDPADLVQALHQVRDVALTGQVPLIFWDEFDTNDLYWLRYFLSPMQDGSFQEGQITHPIGRAIFVFAGGTCPSIAQFECTETDPRYEAFKAAKGPDFVSRLKGYVNILGPDPNSPSGRAGDPHYPIRRAIILRSILKGQAPHIFADGNGGGTVKIDPGVLRAFLEVSNYRHGARSMEAVVSMSMLAGKQSFQRSSLPSREQLELHVDGRQFIALVQAPELEGELLEKLAEAVHRIYQRQALEKARAEGTEPPDAATRSYQQLEESFKELNRANVRDIATKLAAIDYVMIPARSNEPPFGFPGADLDRLAEMEHERWMAQKVAQGWVHGPERDNQRKTNPALLPWQPMTPEQLRERYPALAHAMGAAGLSEAEKEKDRELVTEIPAILAEAGYTVVKLPEPA